MKMRRWITSTELTNKQKGQMENSMFYYLNYFKLHLNGTGLQFITRIYRTVYPVTAHCNSFFWSVPKQSSSTLLCPHT